MVEFTQSPCLQSTWVHVCSRTCAEEAAEVISVLTDTFKLSDTIPTALGSLRMTSLFVSVPWPSLPVRHQLCMRRFVIQCDEPLYDQMEQSSNMQCRSDLWRSTCIARAKAPCTCWFYMYLVHFFSEVSEVAAVWLYERSCPCGNHRSPALQARRLLQFDSQSVLNFETFASNRRGKSTPSAERQKFN